MIIIAMIMYVGLALYFDIGKASRVALKIDFWTLPLILAPMTGAILLLAFRFHRLLLALNISIRVGKSILIYLTGLTFALTPISSGQALRSQIIKKELNHAFSTTSPILLFEKWCELASALIILVIFNFVNFIPQSVPIIIIGVVLAVLFFGFMRKQGLLSFFFKKITSRFQRLKKFEQSIENSQDSLKNLSSRKVVMLESFIITIPAQFLQAASVFLAFQIMGLNIDFISSTQIFYTSLIAGIISFIPGGLGITEAGMIALLTNYYPRYDPSLLAASVIFVRLITFWYPTFLGGITGLTKYRGFFLARKEKNI